MDRIKYLMSVLAANLFRWLQSAEFYREFHDRAVGSIQAREGTDWLDVGCGPGLLSRIAAMRGFNVIGADMNSRMIDYARAVPVERTTFRVEALDELLSERRSANVVSASSLLAVVPEPVRALEQLIQLVRPGGVLLVIEAGSGFKWGTGLGVLLKGSFRGRAQLLLWLLVRSGRTVDESLFEREARRFQRMDLLYGMVTAWTLNL